MWRTAERRDKTVYTRGATARYPTACLVRLAYTLWRRLAGFAVLARWKLQREKLCPSAISGTTTAVCCCCCCYGCCLRHILFRVALLLRGLQRTLQNDWVSGTYVVAGRQAQTETPHCRRRHLRWCYSSDIDITGSHSWPTGSRPDCCARGECACSAHESSYTGLLQCYFRDVYAPYLYA